MRYLSLGGSTSALQAASPPCVGQSHAQPPRVIPSEAKNLVPPMALDRLHARSVEIPFTSFEGRLRGAALAQNDMLRESRELGANVKILSLRDA